jgi:hypothetical protein
MKSWKDITLATAMEIMELEKNSGEMDKIDFIIERLSILEDRDISEVENQTPEKIFADNEKFSFLRTMPKAKFIERTKIGGKEYAIAPLDKLTLAQMVDIEEFYKGGMEENIDKIISVLLLPVKRKTVLGKIILEDYQYDEQRAEDMRSLDMEFVWSNILFFWTIVQEYMTDFQDYLSMRMEKAKMKKQIVSSPNILMEHRKDMDAKLLRMLKGMPPLTSIENGDGLE